MSGWEGDLGVVVQRFGDFGWLFGRYGDVFGDGLDLIRESDCKRMWLRLSKQIAQVGFKPRFEIVHIPQVNHGWQPGLIPFFGNLNHNIL